MPEGITKGSPKKPTKESITESIKTITQEMVVIATLKEAIASYFTSRDGYYTEEIAPFCQILGRLELSLMLKKQLLDEAQKALLELKNGR